MAEYGPTHARIKELEDQHDNDRARIAELEVENENLRAELLDHPDPNNPKLYVYDTSRELGKGFAKGYRA